MRKVLGGAVVGLSATLLMEYVSSFLYEREGGDAREREDRGRKDDMPTTTLTRKLARTVGRELDDEKANRLGTVTHYVFGAAGGPAALALHQAGMDPIKAGLVVGVGMWVFVDEGFNVVAGLTAGPGQFAVVTHARAAVAHVAYGLTAGLMLAAGAADRTR